MYLVVSHLVGVPGLDLCILYGGIKSQTVGRAVKSPSWKLKHIKVHKSVKYLVIYCSCYYAPREHPGSSNFIYERPGKRCTKEVCVTDIDSGTSGKC